MKRLFSSIIGVIVACSGFLSPAPVRAAAADGTLIKASGPAIYYVMDGKRYVFPNEKVYLTWYADFGSVVSVSDAELASYMIGGNVTYKPGVRMIKIQSDPKVYAVGAGGLLRWIASEDAARILFGNDWNKQIDDVSDAFFFNYRAGSPVFGASDFNAALERAIAGIAADVRARSVAPPAEGALHTAVKSGKWSDASVWGGKIPGPGSRVSIPSNITVTLDADDSGTLVSVDIAGTLEFSKEKSHTLSSRGIDVRAGGSLTVGTEAAPWPAAFTATIRLVGASTEALPGDGLNVQGTLDLHGAKTAKTWTRLAAPAAAGATEITLDAAVDWPTGSDIVLSTGSATNSKPEAATFVSKEGATLQLDKPLAHAHFFEGGAIEVGLLSRNVSVVGTGNGQGSSVRVSGSGKARLSHVEFDAMGHRGSREVAPVVFDAASEGSLSSLKGVSFHDSVRCVAISRTTGVSIEQSVAYGITGDCFSMDDGTETSAVLRGNLVVDVKKAGDQPVAAFHLRHPGAILDGNVVVGSEGHGIWYDLPEEVARLNGLKVRPREADLGLFKDNEVRRAAKDGLRVDDAGDGRMNYSPLTKASFSGYRGLHNERGFWMRGSNLEVTGATLLANKVGGAFAAFGAVLKDSTVTGNPDSASSTPTARVGFLFIDGPVTVVNTTFRNFVGSATIRSAALGFLDFNEKPVDPLSGYRGLTFVNARVWDALSPTKAGEKMSVVRDIDGGRAIAMNTPYLDHSCSPLQRNVLACPGTYAQLLVSVRDIDARADSFERVDSGASVTLSEGPAFDGTYAYGTVIEGLAYRFVAADTRSLGVDYYGQQGPLTLRIKTTENASVKEGINPWRKTDLATLEEGTWAYDAATGEAVIKLGPGDSVSVTW